MKFPFSITFSELPVVESLKIVHWSFNTYAPANLLWAAQTGIGEIKKSARTKQWPWQERSDVPIR